MNSYNNLLSKNPIASKEVLLSAFYLASIASDPVKLRKARRSLLLTATVSFAKLQLHGFIPFCCKLPLCNFYRNSTFIFLANENSTHSEILINET